MKNQTTTIETRYLRTLLEVNAQEAGMIVQRFARLTLGEDAEPTGDRFLDYIGAEMAECAARIADYYEERAQDFAELGRRSGESRRAKRTPLNDVREKTNDVERRSQNANGVPEMRTALNGVHENANDVELNIPNHTEPNHTKSNRTESEKGSDSGSVEISGGSVSDSGSAAAGNGNGVNGVNGGLRFPEVEEADRRAANGEKPLKSDFLHVAPMAVVPATLRLIDEAGNKAMHTRLGKAWRRLGDQRFREIVHSFAAELEAGEIPDNLGAALNARLTKAEGGAA